MVKAIFIVGLPGSGKSRYAQQLSDEIDAIIFDDFKADAIENCSHFPFARSYVKLVNALRSGKDCIISDIDFCVAKSIDEAGQCIKQLIRDVKVEWIYFQNNPKKCYENVVQRAKEEGRQDKAPIKALRKYSELYVIPDGANIIQVWDVG